MSDDEGSSAAKRRRVGKIAKACDVCRRKKIRCDGIQAHGKKCTNCIDFNAVCTFAEVPKPKSLPATMTKEYIEGLEARVKELEALLQQKLTPEESSEVLGSFTQIRGQSSSNPLPRVNGNSKTKEADIGINILRKLTLDLPESVQMGEDDLAVQALSERFKASSSESEHVPFMGMSSGAMLLKTAIDLKEQYTGNGTDWNTFHHEPDTKVRQEQWEYLNPPESRRPFEIPDEDLLKDLVDLYFKHVNRFVPLLHRPTFERNLAQNLHRQDFTFGAVVLLVCAVASRYTQDPRVLPENADTWLASGWHWFNQVHQVYRHVLTRPSLHDLQYYCLTTQFLAGSATPQASWIVVGTALRLAQDIGIHRRKSSGVRTAEDELLKRAFWALLTTDYLVSATLGRPCAVHDEDFDVDLPVECDDMYWDHPNPELRFHQPEGKPSYIASFNSFIKLMRLHGLALRMIYRLDKQKIVMGLLGPDWEQSIVAELDSSLNKWVDSVPEHLKWNPTREDETFFNQSALLYIHYYSLQILIHRAFIPTAKKPSRLSFPSLSICTNAARSCSHILDVLRRGRGCLQHFTPVPAFSAGIILLLNVWRNKRSGVDSTKEMQDIYKCMDAIKDAEARWYMAGRIWDVLDKLASVQDPPPPSEHGPNQNKRLRNADASLSQASPDPPSAYSDDTSANRPVAGSKRATISVQRESTPSNAELFPLPVRSVDLGRLPLHGQLNYSSHSQNAEGCYWFSGQDGLEVPSTMQRVGTVDSQTTSPSNSDMNEFPDLGDAYLLDQFTSSMMANNDTMANYATTAYMPTDPQYSRPPLEGDDSSSAMWTFDGSPINFHLTHHS